MRIAQVCPRYYPYFGGVSTHVQNISERLVKRGHEVHVYTTDPSGKISSSSNERNGVLVHYFKAFIPGESFYISRDLYHALRETEYDVIHGHVLYAFPLLFAMLARRSKGFVVTLHTGGSSSYVRKMLHIPYHIFMGYELRKNVNKIICVSRYEARIFPRVLIVPQDRFCYIPNGIDLDEFDVGELKTKNGLEHVILSVGRLEKYKGFHFLIKSFALLCDDKKYSQDTRLIIVGKGPYKAKLVKLATKMNLGDKISILSDVERSELIKLYKQCDVFVLLSEYESYGLVVTEALAAQSPVITTRRGALNEFVRRGLSIGVDWPPSALDVATKIKNIMSKPSIYKPAKIRLPSWDYVTERLIACYKQSILD